MPSVPLQSRIDGLALQRQNRKCTFMNAAQWLAFDESLQAFHAQCKLTKGEPALSAYGLFAVPGNVFGAKRDDLLIVTCLHDLAQ